MPACWSARGKYNGVEGEKRGEVRGNSVRAHCQKSGTDAVGQLPLHFTCLSLAATPAHYHHPYLPALSCTPSPLPLWHCLVLVLVLRREICNKLDTSAKENVNEKSLRCKVKAQKEKLIRLIIWQRQTN